MEVKESFILTGLVKEIELNGGIVRVNWPKAPSNGIIIAHRWWWGIKYSLSNLTHRSGWHANHWEIIRYGLKQTLKFYRTTSKEIEKNLPTEQKRVEGERRETV